MSEGFVTSLKKYTTKDKFDKETILEDLDLEVVNYDEFSKVVFENDNFKIYKATAPEGLIPLCAGTRWLANGGWNADKKTGYDEVDTDAHYGPWAEWDKYYIIISKHDPKKKWMFKDGYGDIYVPSYTRYPCATWVAEHGDTKMWKWFLDQKFPYISTNLDKKVGSKMMGDKTTFIYPDDADKLTFHNKQGSNITKVEFAPGVKTIKARAFCGLQQVKEIIVPEGVTTINSHAFYNCGVEKIVLPSTLKTIGDSAFNHCTALREINLPEGITKMGDYAFYGDAALDKMPEWPKSLTTIPHYCFEHTGFTEIIIPDHVKVIGNGAFDGVTVKTVIIPNSVESIGINSFEGSYLKYVYIPSSVQYIDQYAFGSIHSWNRDTVQPELVIDCEVSEKPESWNVNWDVYDRLEKREYRHNWDNWDDPNRWEYKRYKVNWGISSPRASIKEDLELDSDVSIPGLLTDEQCEKLLDLLVSLPEMAEKDKEQWNHVYRDWLLNIWMSTGTPSKLKLDSYIGTLSDPSIKHVLRYWAKDPFRGGINYIISRFTEEGLDYVLGGDYNCDDRIDKSYDICVSTSFVKDFLHADTTGIRDEWNNAVVEDLELDVADGFSPDYQDDHWLVYHPKNADEFLIMSDGTTWYDSRNDDDYTDYRLTNYYTSIPYYIFENKDTGRKWLYNTRESWGSLVDEQGHNWTSEAGHNYLGYSRSAGNTLGAFLASSENAEGVAKWAIRKWPQGLKELKHIVDSRKILNDANGIVVYKSDLYNKIHEYYWWDKKAKPYEIAKHTAQAIAFPRNTQKVEPNAFREFKSIKEIVLPNTIKEIGEYAFSSCESVEKIVLPKQVQVIGEGAFNGCKKVSGSIVIPASCKSIGQSAFKYCPYETIYCEAPSKPEGWSDDWDISKDVYEDIPAQNGRPSRRQRVEKRFDVVWGSSGPVKEELELDTINSEVEIPEDKKGEVALLLGVSPAEKRLNMRWWMDLEPYEETSRIIITPYKVHIGDRVYFITANLANRLLKQLNIDYKVTEPEFN